MIEGVELKKLEIQSDQRGHLMEILRSDDAVFTQFGQVYLTIVYPGVTKGWHLHRRKHDYTTCVRGMLKMVLYDGREESSTKGEINVFFIGEYNPIMVHVPPEVHHALKCISVCEALIVNCSSEVHDRDNPDEYGDAIPDSEVPYNWEFKFH